MCKKCYRKSCKSIRNNQKNQLYNCIKVSSTTVWRYMTNNGWKALKRKRRRTCGHGVRMICKIYSKGWLAGKLTWCEPFRDHLDYRWRDNIQRYSPKTLDELRQWLRFAWENVSLDTLLGARTVYASPLIRKYQKT